jgi:hypothetical protein
MFSCFFSFSTPTGGALARLEDDWRVQNRPVTMMDADEEVWGKRQKECKTILRKREALIS